MIDNYKFLFTKYWSIYDMIMKYWRVCVHGESMLLNRRVFFYPCVDVLMMQCNGSEYPVPYNLGKAS